MPTETRLLHIKVSVIFFHSRVCVHFIIACTVLSYKYFCQLNTYLKNPLNLKVLSRSNVVGH